MATTFTWTIDSMWVENKEGYTDYVVRADYTLTGVDGEYSASLNDIQQFEVIQGEDFIPYADLTEEIVIGWIQENLGTDTIENMEASINGVINTEKNPPVEPTKEPLPWS